LEAAFERKRRATHFVQTVSTSSIKAHEIDLSQEYLAKKVVCNGKNEYLCTQRPGGRLLEVIPFKK